MEKLWLCVCLNHGGDYDCEIRLEKGPKKKIDISEVTFPGRSLFWVVLMKIPLQDLEKV